MLHDRISSKKQARQFSPAVIYHWWDPTIDYVWESAHPLITSIASLRSQDRITPVYVLDCTGLDKVWANYPQKLDFTVVKWPCELNRFVAESKNPKDSRMLDVWKFCQKLNEDLIIYCDADTLWFRPVSPLENLTDKVTCTEECDLFYFNKKEAIPELFFENYKAFITASVSNAPFFKFLKNKNKLPYKTPHMKTVMTDLMQEHAEWFVKPAPKEHIQVNEWTVGSRPKTMHLSKLRMAKKGEVLVLFKEIYEAVEKNTLLAGVDYAVLYGSDRFVKLRKYQVSLQDEDFVSTLNEFNCNMRAALENYLRVPIITM